MPRNPRILSPEGVYHVYCRGNNRQNVFIKEQDKVFYINLLHKIKREHNFNLYHYVLMDNHLHMVIQTKIEGSPLSDFMKIINLTYTLYFRRQYNYIGHLWQDRFGSKLVQMENYLLQCGIYIELNPVQAKIVSAPEKYHWSSYRYYAMGASDDILDENPVFGGLAHTRKEGSAMYREMAHDSMLRYEELQEKMDYDFIGDSSFRTKKKYMYKPKAGAE